MKKISVITPTWQRHQLLTERCIPSVQAQTIPVEHVVVSDGPDPELRAIMADYPHIKYAQVVEHHDRSHGLFACGDWAINTGLDVATGDYFTVLDDDNSFRPRHCEALSKALDEGDSDFVYSEIYRVGIGDLVGSTHPHHGGIDGNALMWRRDTHEKYGRWPIPCIDSPDWAVVRQWMDQGATYTFVHEVTVDWYYHPGGLSWRG